MNGDRAASDGAPADRCLAGRTVGITASRRVDEQERFFQRRGATTVLGPSVRSVTVAEEPAFRAATQALIDQPPDVVLLHTGTGVRAWFRGAEELGVADQLREALRGAVVYARGPKAVRAASEQDLEVAWRSPGGRFGDLVARVAAEHQDARVALQLDGELDAEDADEPAGSRGGPPAPDGSDSVLVQALRAATASIVAVPVYRWALPDDPGPAHELVRRIADGTVDAVTFTSSPAVAGLVELAREIDLDAAMCHGFASTVVAASIGEVCSATLRRHGIEPAVEPERPRLGALLLAVTERLARRA